MNQIVKSGQMWQPPAVGTRDGNWVWDGSNWVCDPDCFPPPPCPPFGPPVFSGPAGQPPWYPGANGGVSFGQTAPPNPVRGHFWFDGTTLWIFDGAAWDAVGGEGQNLTPPSTGFPSNPAPGQQAFVNGILYIWDGKAWVPTTGTKTYIQATAPPAPNPGDTWFNGTVFYVWDGSAWEVVGPGATVGPVPTTTEVFAIPQPTATTLPAGSAWGIVQFNVAPSLNTQSGSWDSIGMKFTPKVAGAYFFTSRGLASGAGGMSLLKNDPGTFDAVGGTNQVISATSSLSGGGWMQSTGLSQMNGTTDYARLWAWESGGSLPGAGGNPIFSAWLLP